MNWTRLPRLPMASLLLALPTIANASWPPGGMLVSSPGDINLVRNARIMDMASGDLCVLGIGNGGMSNDYVIQRVSRDGVIAPGWPAAGVSFSYVPKGHTLRDQSIIVDDASRTWHSWPMTTYSLQSVAADASATPAPGTAFNLGSTSGFVMHAAPAPGDEVFVTCSSSRLKRITAAGGAASGWTSTGVTLPGFADDENALMADGSGGAVVFMREGAAGLPTSGLPIATRIDGNGVRHAGWPAAGLALSGASVGFNSNSQVLSSGPDHVLAVWSLDAGSGTRRLMMQRFGLDATIDPAWPGDGLEVVASDTLIACRAIADGSGGAYVVRQSHGHPVATHITAAGGTLGGPDVEFVDAGAQYFPTRVYGTGIPDDMIADVTPDGGLLVGWNDTRLAPAVTFRLRWLTPSLTPAPGKPDAGLVFYPDSPHPFAGSLLNLRADGADGAFIAWGDYHDIGFGQGWGDLWMTHVVSPTPVGVPTVAPRALALSAPRPNPARVSVAFDLALPDDSPARVELLDVAGRVVRTRLVQGVGTHPIEFGGLATLAPGLYFARASARAGSSSVRLVVSR